MNTQFLSLVAGAMILLGQGCFAQVILNVNPINQTYFFSGSSDGYFFGGEGDDRRIGWHGSEEISTEWWTGTLPAVYLDGELIPLLSSDFLLGSENLFFGALTNAPRANYEGTLTLDSTVISYADASPAIQAYLLSLNGVQLPITYGTFEAVVQVIPEPSTYLLALAPLAWLSFRFRRERKGLC